MWNWNVYSVRCQGWWMLIHVGNNAQTQKVLVPLPINTGIVYNYNVTGWFYRKVNQVLQELIIHLRN